MSVTNNIIEATNSALKKAFNHREQPWSSFLSLIQENLVDYSK